MLESKNELEEQIKRADAINNWDIKIKTAFKALENHITPIKDEHDRLVSLFRIYGGLTVVVIALLVYAEIEICCKIAKVSDFPAWQDYIPTLLPVPIALGLLWGFITQMNRAQLQMVILAKQIYEIKYIEGLLLTVNTLSINLNQTIDKIHSALDKLINNHLRFENKLLADEASLENEVNKEKMPYDTVLERLKELKGILWKE